ncbi:hypothetical protein [Vagococcus acidifermentans]|uniref:Uncharacterized protein n=1 Tax=Vagococcus acidifermentans TaxID=564710 RepID=A0A430AP03_9ENTE|nr:hypothetical protein [Vagococcus acidifermentans]RSU09805.1 hypothetical protein CBF27_12020 [Vagococcus acidifermentans]
MKDENNLCLINVLSKTKQANKLLLSFFTKKGEIAIFKHKGKRIKPSDTNLLYHISLGVFGVAVLLVMALFHLHFLMRTDWKTITVEEILSQFHTPYFLGSVLTVFFVCLLGMATPFLTKFIRCHSFYHVIRLPLTASLPVCELSRSASQL